MSYEYMLASLGDHVLDELEKARQIYLEGDHRTAIARARGILKALGVTDKRRPAAETLVKLLTGQVPGDGTTLSDDIMRNL